MTSRALGLRGLVRVWVCGCVVFAPTWIHPCRVASVQPRDDRTHSQDSMFGTRKTCIYIKPYTLQQILYISVEARGPTNGTTLFRIRSKKP